MSLSKRDSLQASLLIMAGTDWGFYCQGGDSDDDNAEDSPDEDQYDTDDPFIDDEELVCVLCSSL